MAFKSLFSKNKTFQHSIVHHMIYFICILVCVIILLCSCIQSPINDDNSSTTDKATSAQDSLSSVRKWLDTDFSFNISYQYTNLAINGLSQETTQIFADDGSWSFSNKHKFWDHTTDYEQQDSADFYYRYENSQLICYSIVNDNEPQRSVLNNSDLKAMDDSKAYLIGVPGLLPDYLQDLSVTKTYDATVFTYMLPVENVLSDSTLLSTYIKNVFKLSHYEYQHETKLKIGCKFETNPETFQPKSLSFDFSQLKPYVLSKDAQSGEQYFETEFMTMVFTFDYNLPPTIAIPENLIQ